MIEIKNYRKLSFSRIQFYRDLDLDTSQQIVGRFDSFQHQRVWFHQTSRGVCDWLIADATEIQPRLP